MRNAKSYYREINYLSDLTKGPDIMAQIWKQGDKILEGFYFKQFSFRFSDILSIDKYFILVEEIFLVCLTFLYFSVLFGLFLGSVLMQLKINILFINDRG